jgi:hypothetical protein
VAREVTWLERKRLEDPAIIQVSQAAIRSTTLELETAALLREQRLEILLVLQEPKTQLAQGLEALL